MKKALALFALLMSSASVSAQTQPAQMGITPTTLPEVLQVLDNTKTWVPIGSVNSTTHKFSAIGGEADILVTDPSIGMRANDGTDNSAFVAALMNAQMPPEWGGYDVLFPAISGQARTIYYFSQPFVNERTGNYHCSGSVGYLSTYLVFAPGVDGFVQEIYTNTPDGGIGGGVISSCKIVSLGYGAADITSGSPILTGVAFSGVPGVPSPVWHVGDGILLTPSLNGFLPSDAIFSVPVGTTITAVDGSTGNLTLSNPVTQSTGSIFNAKATATFTQTGTNNFSPNDTIKVGSIAYTFRNYSMSVATGSAVPYDVLLGADFAASANNLVAAINGGAGQYSTYAPARYGEDAYLPNLLITASYASGVITFTSRYGPPNANAYPSVYTPTSTAAGAFGGGTFLGASASPVTVGGQFYQLPATQAFKVRTTAGSQNVTVVSGPRPIHANDVIFSDAFRFGTTVRNASGALGAQTLVMTDAAASAVPSNATITHAPGAEGNLWILPAGIKRRTPANAERNFIAQWPIGLSMACSSADSNGANCDLSRDQQNSHDQNFVGRWVAGDNTATATSMNEQFSGNYLADVWEGGTLGEIYYNLDTSSPEAASSHWNVIKNCANQNYSVVFGGYLVGGGNGCAIDGFPYPPTYGGITVFAGLANGVNGANGHAGASNTFYNGMQIAGGADGADCVNLSGPANAWWVIAFSFAGCNNTNAELAMSWNGAGAWLWTMEGPAGAAPMAFLDTNWGYAGYAGPFGKGVMFPYGVVLGDYAGAGARNLLSMSAAVPTTSGRQSGDVIFNASAVAGGAGAWRDIGGTIYPADPIANDTAGARWTLGNYMTLTPVSLASLPATCSPGTFAVINNGVAAPVYNAAVGSTTGAATDPVFCTNGNVWKYH